MSELNAEQRRLAEEFNGFIVVDAGPGTGKTHTIVQRYVNMIQADIPANDILMLTFTRNAAQEMRDRITSGLLSVNTGDETRQEYLRRSVRNIRSSTFDSLCLDVVLNSPSYIKEFFGTEETLSRNASLVENETLNRQYFSVFYDLFVRDHLDDYAGGDDDPVAVLAGRSGEIYSLLCRLMSRGVIPLRDGWFRGGLRTVRGDPDAIRAALDANPDGLKTKLREVRNASAEYDLSAELSILSDDELIDMAVNDGREGLLDFVHDVYHGFISQCIKDNRLTFGLCELFAYAILLKNVNASRMHSVRYLTVDEFQDTNELQMKICLLLLKEGNFCAVGDWKQGIYGFRFVSIDNINRFGERLVRFTDELEASGVDFDYRVTEPLRIDFTRNYRSSPLILDKAFQSLSIPATTGEKVAVEGNIVELEAENSGGFGDRTGFSAICCEDEASEISAVADMIIEYVRSGRYRIVEDGKERDVGFGDIAVLARTSKYCTAIKEECRKRNIPAFLQGDMEVMNSREGKLALAWLRYVNNPSDTRGIAAIMADMGMPLSEIRPAIGDAKYSGDAELKVPRILEDLRSKLAAKKRRPNELLTLMYKHYGLNNENTQTVIGILSSAYTGSLMTISDLIRLIEDDISGSTTYRVEPLLNSKAVTIQTAHKSKGLEYPIVIVAGMNKKMFPSTQGDKGKLIFSDGMGIRMIDTLVSDGKGSETVMKSWRTHLIRAGYPRDYSEERRLLFVAMTRAKQYLALTCHEPSTFFSHYSDGTVNTVPEKGIELDPPSVADPAARPLIGSYERRRASLSAHDLMDTLTVPIPEGRSKGKGAEYGERVHQAAYLYAVRKVRDDSLPEMDAVAAIVDRLRDADLRAEVRCVLPVGMVSVKGTIDLIAEYDDRIEIHDYKTDEDKEYLAHYIMQLSVYAHAALGKGKKVRCFIDFVSIGESVEVEPLPMERIAEAAERYFIASGIGPGMSHNS